MKKVRKIIALILTVLTLVSIFSVSTPVFAAEAQAAAVESEYEEKLLTETVKSEEEKAKIMYEVPEKRDEYTKTYKRADGSYTSVFSQTPIHTLKDGEWEEIDNTLLSVNGILKNTEGSFDVEFPETISENNQITLTNNGESIAFSVNGIDNSAAVISTEEATVEKDIIEEDLSKTVSEITYENVDENTNIQYIVSSGFIKENIIINEKSVLKDTYSFDIEKGNLIAFLDENNNLTFKNEKNEIVFTIPAPVMTDAQNAVSYDIGVTVTNADKSTLTLTYTPSKEWINNKDRVYPVIIDPVISVPDYNDTIIEDTTIYKDVNSPTTASTNYSNSAEGIIANQENIHGEILVKINIDAFSACRNPNIAVTDFSYYGTGLVWGGNIIAKPINGNWDSATITYNDVYPTDNAAHIITYEDTIIDYYTGSPREEDFFVSTASFNITQLFNEWIKGQRANNGFALIAENEQTAAYFMTAGERINAGQVQTLHTYCSIDYVDTTGTNDSYEYLTQEIGRAGTANVNTFTRSLSLNRSDLSIDGLRLPVNIGFNYNPALRTFLDLYMVLEDTDIFFPYGNNWLPANLQGLIEIVDGQWQAFTSEGTLVTFNEKTETSEETDSDGNTTTVANTVFEPDETSDSGYSLEIINESNSISTTNLKLVSPDGRATYFNETGLCVAICDNEVELTDSIDAIRYEYSSSNPVKITKIIDGVGKQYVFNYTSGLLSKINCLTADGTQIKAGTTDNDLCVTYAYDENKNLTGVTYPDGKAVSYTYSGNKLTKATNIDNYNIQYTYDTLGKVTKITERAGSTRGNYITLSELSNRQVKITDAYTGVEIHQFGKDGRLNYTFDKNGNLCKSDYAKSNEDVLSLNGWKVDSENLLKNGSFETSSNKLPTHWDNAFHVDFIDATNSLDSACKIESETASNKLQSQTVDVDGGKNFTFSVYAKSNTEDLQETDKLYLRIIAVDEDEEETSKSISITPTNEFEQYSVSVETSTETDYVTVEFGLKNKTGNFLVNNAQLERGKGTAEFNYIENSTFNYLTNNEPDNWSEATIVDDTILGESVNAVELDGGLPYYEQSGETYTLNDSVSAITQNVKINGKKGEVYSVGGWFKGLFDDNYINPEFTTQHSETNAQLTSSAAQIKVSYNYNEISTDENGIETTNTVNENFVVDFAPHNDSWQYAEDCFALKADVNAIDVTVITKNIPSTSYATNISLTRNFDGELLESDETTDEEAEDTDSTDETEELCSCGCEDCLYGENCPCTGAINNDCQCPECLRGERSTEDDFGNTLSNKSFDSLKYIETLSSYTQDGNYLASYTNERGNITTYDYNTLNGILEAVTMPVGTGDDTTTTSYEYDAMGNVVSVATTVSDNVSQELEYVYTNDRLTEIITPNGKYEIVYDVWGQVLSVDVVQTNGTTVPLIEYTYNSGALRTQVATVTYINSDENDKTYEYTYSDDGNVVNIKENSNNKHIITYNNLGELTELKNIGGRTIKYVDNGMYIYNDKNQLIYTSVTDSEGKVTEENYGIKYTEKDTEYSYDSETGNSTNTNALDVASYYRIEQAATTDYFGRENKHLTTVYDITEETEETPAEVIGKIETSYEYPVSSDGKTSSLIDKYVNKTYNGDSETERVYDGYYYEYDKQNKISVEKALNQDGTTADRYSYEYDKLGQLVRYNSAVENKSYTYEYDNNGNITAKKEYAYSTGVLGDVVKTTSYTYDTQWKDLLTGVDGQNITYDNIGNPTSYLGANLTWEGRDLTSYENEDNKFEYLYDENGMRYRTTITNKEDNSVGYLDYVWVDSKLISISFTSDELNQTVKYLYNDFDEPVGFVSTREDGSVDTYYYLKNAQGDITNIVSASGKKMVSFTYDVFGKRTVEYQANDSTTPSHIELLTQIKADLLNPFAYRGYCYDYDMGMYYLQSRYYDPNTGRFINADDTNYLNATGTVLGCNLFAYCENDPVNNVDPKGNSYASTASWLLPMLYSSILTLKLAKAALLVKIGAMITAIAPYLIAVVAAVAAVVLVYYTARVITAQKADAKVRSKVTRNSKTRYWSATISWSHVDIGKPLTYSQAVSYVKKGYNVFTVTWYEAKAVALAAGGTTGRNNKKLYSEKHGQGKGFYWHYHTYNRKGGHVFYLF